MQHNPESTQNILFIINPVSGDIDKTAFKNIVNSNKYRNIISEFYMTTGNNDIERIENIIHRNSFDKLCAVGGDGTFNLVARVSLTTKIPMGHVPMGTANGMARQLNIPLDIDRALNLLMNAKAKPIDVVKINDQYISVHYCDIGANARVMKRFERVRKGGFIEYIKQYYKELMNVHKTSFSFNLNGETISKKVTMVMLANASLLGTGAVMNPLGKVDDGKFELIIIKQFPKWFFLVIIAYSLFGNLNKLRYFKTYQSSRVTITASEKQQLQVDGEPVEQVKKVHARIIPKAIEVFCN